MSTPPLTRLERQGPIARLWLERDDARNSLSLDLIDQLRAAVRALAQDPACTVLVLSGGGKAFCAGMDLKAVVADDAPGNPTARALLGSLAELCLELRALPAVTLARVNGAAVGGGCGLACVCDLALTHADSKMGFPEVDLGVCPAVVAPWLVRKIGAGRARRVLLSGGLLSGREAHALGIADHLVETREQLDPAADAIAQRLARSGPQALRATKSLLNELDASIDRELSARAASLSASVLARPEARAALAQKIAPR